MAKRYSPFLVALVLVFALAAADARDRKCSPQDATEADAVVDQLNSWQKVADAFKRYGHCDSGSIAEGNSEAVARLLVDRWNTLPTLIQLSTTIPGLRRFVVGHVDSTLDTSDLERIAQLSASSCPKRATSFCGELHKSAAAALGTNER